MGQSHQYQIHDRTIAVQRPLKLGSLNKIFFSDFSSYKRINEMYFSSLSLIDCRTAVRILKERRERGRVLVNLA